MKRREGRGKRVVELVRVLEDDRQTDRQTDRQSGREGEEREEGGEEERKREAKKTGRTKDDAHTRTNKTPSRRQEQ